MTFNVFQTTDPGVGEIDLFISGGSNVAGITISTQNCTSTNFSYTIQQATSISINGTEFDITEKVPYSTHYFINTELTPFNTASSGVGTGECIQINFSPFVLPIPFTYNDYNAILGNTLGKYTDSEGRLVNFEGLRTTSFIFDVDRTNDQIVPLNIENILTGKGTPAKFVESSHTDTGLANARYNGTKTSISDYGTLSAFSAVSFKGSTYGVDTTNQLICSQSSENRVIKDLLYAPNPQATVSFENLEEVPQIRYKSLGAPAPGEIISGSTIDTDITYYSYIDISVGDILRIGGAIESTGEIMKVVSITTQTPSETTFEAIRAYKKDVYSSNTARTIGTTTTKLEKVIGDTIYNAESNQVYRIKDKKIWVQDTLQVFYTDDTGQLLFELETCTV